MAQWEDTEDKSWGFYAKRSFMFAGIAVHTSSDGSLHPIRIEVCSRTINPTVFKLRCTPKQLMHPDPMCDEITMDATNITAAKQEAIDRVRVVLHQILKDL